jgi:phage/plasmid-like protein (TIGR03299 family)
VANVRSDTGAVLGVVGAGYRVFQNREAFDFLDALVGEGLAAYETAGALKGGRRVWLLARIPRELRPAGDDLVLPYALLTNTHDGSMALRMIPTTVRVVWQNTLNLALGRAGAGAGLTVRHRDSLAERVQEARAKLGLVTRRVKRFEAEAQALAGHVLSTREADAYFRSVFPVPGQEDVASPADGLLDRMLDAAADRVGLVEELRSSVGRRWKGCSGRRSSSSRARVSARAGLTSAD